MTRYLRVRLDAATAARLDRACLATGRSPSELVRHAIAYMAVADNRPPGPSPKESMP